MKVIHSECSVCRHADLKSIDYLICTGERKQAIADRFALEKDAVHRHAARHISPTYKDSVALYGAICTRVLASGDSGAALGDPVQRLLGLHQRLASLLKPAPPRDLAALPELKRLREKLDALFITHPVARKHVAAAFDKLREPATPMEPMEAEP